MRRTLKLVLPVPPSVNSYLYAKVIRLGKRPIARLAETDDSKAYKFKVAPIIKQQMLEQNWEQPENGVFLDTKIDFFFQRKGMDANNFLKILYDVFTEVNVWEDDQFSKPQTGIVVIDKFNPRIEITITTSQQHGLFLNEFDRSEFIDKYEHTMPKRSWVALMKKLDEGRITENTFYDKNQKVILRED